MEFVMLSYRDLNTLYVAPGAVGDGKAPETPLGSLADAFSTVEMMRGGGMLQPITLKLLAGEYLLTAPLSVRPTMSNVTVEPFGNGAVLLSGGKKITGFEKTTFMSVSCYGVYLEEVKSGTWKFTDLYVNGLRAEKTRLPDQGYFRMKETEVPSSELFAPSKWFVAEDADLDQFKSLYAFADALVSFNHYWIDEHTPIESLDTENGRVTMTYRSRFNIRPGQEYILENVAEQFKNPGEWYLDRANGMLYYIPRDESETPDTIDVHAPVTAKLIEIKGNPAEDDHVTGVHFRGLHFAYTRGDYGSGLYTDGTPEKELFGSDSQAVSNAHGSVEISYARNVSFADCALTNYGVHGFNLKDGCRSVRIEGCTIYDGGAGGVRICGGGYGSPLHTRTTGCSVTDCKITHVGRRYYSACGILIMHASETDILYNEIGDLYYTGVSVGWTWGYAKTVCRDNRIIGNHIYDLGKGFLSDMGGVYLLGSQPGTVVRNNKIHDIKCKEYGGWALYTDEGSAGMLLEKNLCYRTSSNSYHQHYGTSNVVRDNIFADADEPLMRLTRDEPHLSIMFYNNILYSTGTAILQRYEGNPNGHLENGAILSRCNLIWHKDGADAIVYSTQESLDTFAKAQTAGMEDGSVLSDPGFVDAQNGDYTLRADSPARKMGFVGFDETRCGPRK